MRPPRRTVALTLCLASVGVLAAAWLFSLWPFSPSFPSPPGDLCPVMPEDVDFVEKDNEEKDRPYFDDFAWKEFIALNWPALEGKRDAADVKKKFGDVSQRTVWESWKSIAELFPPHSDPTPWDSFETVPTIVRIGDNGEYNYIPLPGFPENEAGKIKVLNQVSALEDVLEGEQSPRMQPYPLIAQNHTYVRFEIRVNQLEYDYVLGKNPQHKKLFLRSELPPLKHPPGLQFEDGSISVKAAWMELPDDEKVRSRFYHVPAKIVYWGEEAPRDKEVGLVGLHIVHKTPKRRNWIWATFEHVDNTKLSPGGISPPSFNSKDEGMPWGDPRVNHKPANLVEIGKKLPENVPVEVARKTETPATTERINQRYREHRQIKETVWHNYRLVATQWPRRPGYGDRDRHFPYTNVANTTMETYHQNDGCINCHSDAKNVNLVFFMDIRPRDVGPRLSEETKRAREKVWNLLEASADAAKLKSGKK